MSPPPWSYDTFHEATFGKNLYQARFSNLKISISFWGLSPILCKWAQFLHRSNLYIATLIDFLAGADLAPPPPIHRIWTSSQVGLRSFVRIQSREDYLIKYFFWSRPKCDIFFLFHIKTKDSITIWPKKKLKNYQNFHFRYSEK